MVCAVPRPRLHDPDRVLDVVESLTARSGPAAVTIRAVETAAGVSNGALYHAFGSRAGLLGAAWLRAGRRFLELQAELVGAAPAAVEAAVEAAAEPAVAAVVAAADAPVVFAQRHPASSQLLLAVRRTELLGEDLPGGLGEQLRGLQSSLVGLMIRLADGMWNRRDALAVDTITTCVVDLPTAIVLSRNRLDSPIAREQLHAAVRAVLALGPA